MSFTGFVCVLLTGWLTFPLDPAPWPFGLSEALPLCGAAFAFQAFQATAPYGIVTAMAFPLSPLTL